MSLVEGLRNGDKRAVAKLISLIEDGDAAATDAIREIYPMTGNAHVVGVSGPPGTGKSTLIFRLAQEFRKRGKKVGIIAIDPTSPISGGALLGDRVRMGDLASDEGVFIRSMGTRGRLGGVSAATSDAINVLDAYGSEIIFVETAGAGQTDVEVSDLVHTTVVVVMPGVGDEVQALKAGLFEVAHIFVVNKADLGDADRVASDLSMMLELGEQGDWTPPVLTAVALRGEAATEVADFLEEHLTHLGESGRMEEKKRRRAEKELMIAISESVLERSLALSSGRSFMGFVNEVLEKRMSPREAALRLLEESHSGD
ncbi:MAG: methylmalonyl Co-A mutase-associated GTPase MeaB [Thermoplasmata archaeon]